eukprot:CAMPEP_0177757646 /NCGR_PEP_ID=MMETSP0491_2-20121128/3754_1 /TAXON_ID=63592 /ORGANISM="Tetraselmis chuii, Strain PLY429" /LENGTH=129 /DNA_ID=CAMNT_0019273311 /DNA_START=415 /DNA_END=806 /DNA_ORIENTATION=-
MEYWPRRAAPGMQSDECEGEDREWHYFVRRRSAARLSDDFDEEQGEVCHRTIVQRPPEQCPASPELKKLMKLNGREAKVSANLLASCHTISELLHALPGEMVQVEASSDEEGRDDEGQQCQFGNGEPLV